MSVQENNINELLTNAGESSDELLRWLLSAELSAPEVEKLGTSNNVDVLEALWAGHYATMSAALRAHAEKFIRFDDETVLLAHGVDQDDPDREPTDAELVEIETEEQARVINVNFGQGKTRGFGVARP